MEKSKTIPYFITPVEDPTIPHDRVVCRDCGQQIPATFIDMSTHQQQEVGIPTNTVADFNQKK